MTQSKGQFLGIVEAGNDIPFILQVQDELMGDGITLSANPSYIVYNNAKAVVSVGNLTGITGAGRYYEIFSVPSAWADGVYTVEYGISYGGVTVYAEDSFTVGDMGSSITPADVWNYILTCTTPLVPLSAGWHLFNARDMIELVAIQQSRC